MLDLLTQLLTLPDIQPLVAQDDTTFSYTETQTIAHTWEVNKQLVQFLGNDVSYDMNNVNTTFCDGVTGESQVNLNDVAAIAICAPVAFMGEVLVNVQYNVPYQTEVVELYKEKMIKFSLATTLVPLPTLRIDFPIQKGSFLLQVLDATRYFPLNTATFQLIQGDEVVQQGKVNRSGSIEVNDLLIGQYQLTVWSNNTEYQNNKEKIELVVLPASKQYQ